MPPQQSFTLANWSDSVSRRRRRCLLVIALSIGVVALWIYMFIGRPRPADRETKDNDSHLLTPISVIKGHRGIISSLAFSPIDSTLASGSFDGTVKIWDINPGREIRSLKEHSAQVYSISFQPK